MVDLDLNENLDIYIKDGDLAHNELINTPLLLSIFTFSNSHNPMLQDGEGCELYNLKQSRLNLKVLSEMEHTLQDTVDVLIEDKLVEDIGVKVGIDNSTNAIKGVFTIINNKNETIVKRIDL